MSCNCLQRSVLYSSSLLKFCHSGILAQYQKKHEKIFLLCLLLLFFQADISEALISIVKKCAPFLKYLPHPTLLIRIQQYLPDNGNSWGMAPSQTHSFQIPTEATWPFWKVQIFQLTSIWYPFVAPCFYHHSADSKKSIPSWVSLSLLRHFQGFLTVRRLPVLLTFTIMSQPHWQNPN